MAPEDFDYTIKYTFKTGNSYSLTYALEDEFYDVGSNSDPSYETLAIYANGTKILSYSPGTTYYFEDLQDFQGLLVF